MNPGIHTISIEQYHSGPGISRSGLELFRRSPLHYWHEYLNPEREQRVAPDVITKASPLEFGNAFHCYVLEPEQFEKRYMVFEKADGRTKIGKTINEQAALARGARELIDVKAFQEITNMSRSINLSSTAKGLIDGAVYEKSLFWVDSDTGILCKVRPDIWHSNMIGDLKSTRSAAPRDFQRDIHSYAYYVQAGMISEALWTLQGVNMMNFVYVAVEKEAPYATALYKLDENAVNQGREEFKRTLHEFKACIDSGVWPSYPDSVIDLPPYAYTNKEEF